MDDKNIQVVLVTVPDEQTALHIAHKLVEKKLAACVNIIPGVRSIFQWQGKIEDSRELLLVIKTTSDRYQQLEDEVKSLHPYDTPEIIALDVNAGLASYLRWVTEETSR